ncbi:hypothetical protein LY78DRAFT_212739 [Colletotrichum sublineola]|uniref:mRNA 3'-end-processing protein n=1 Tax=Colletotrichum sublineola TaxID=1173701 RepID=A0A066WTJ2_COLSU|nr:hypothetical protein LY78DRAFT_212739 [Colletotrichum sublineola]KDN59992.1 hypothetical protein CSUB01_04583 [Colletotrichum sublineola]
MAAVTSRSETAQILNHTPTATSFSFTPFLRQNYRHELSSDRPQCKSFLAGHCPLGASCPDRHASSTSSNPSGGPSLVCKHWLRGLCKKGESCEFLHEYNLRKMPECNFFMRNGYCSNGEECLYLHIDPQSKLPPCPHYDKGFCPLGPRCSKKHVRRKLCPFYLVGFCPEGPGCKYGAHPRWRTDLEKPTAKVEGEDDAKKEGEKEDGETFQQQQQRERQRDMHDDRGHGDRRHGGRGGGKWRDRGNRRFRGRGH